MTKGSWVRVLVVEDSPVAGKLLSDGIGRDRRHAVAGVATSASDALAMAESLKPDIMIVSLELPDETGLRIIQRVLNKRRIPIIAVSRLGNHGRDAAPFRALAAGAADVVPRPSGQPALSARFFGDLNDKIAALAGAHSTNGETPSRHVNRGGQSGANHIACVVVGASTGGPNALVELLAALGPDFAAPVVIVQHIAPPFVSGLVQWLNSETPLHVALLKDGVRPERRHVYVAPAEAHSLFKMDRRLHIEGVGPEARHAAPSADLLFKSAAQVYGARCAGVLLSGMGRDGADGLLMLRAGGAKTFAQNEQSCSVFGMPAAAGRLGAVEIFAEPRAIGTQLKELVATAERTPG